VVDDILSQYSVLGRLTELNAKGDENDLFSAIDAALAEGTLRRPFKDSTMITTSTIYTDYIVPVLNVLGIEEFQDIDVLLSSLTDAVVNPDGSVEVEVSTAEDTVGWMTIIRRMINADYLEANDKLQVRMSDGVYALEFGKERTHPRGFSKLGTAGTKLSSAAATKEVAGKGKKKNPSAYNLYVKSEGPQVRLDFRGISPQDAMSEIAARWKVAPENPKNQAASSKAAGSKTRVVAKKK